MLLQTHNTLKPIYPTSYQHLFSGRRLDEQLICEVHSCISADFVWPFEIGITDQVVNLQQRTSPEHSMFSKHKKNEYTTLCYNKSRDWSDPYRIMLNKEDQHRSESANTLERAGALACVTLKALPAKPLTKWPVPNLRIDHPNVSLNTAASEQSNQ